MKHIRAISATPKKAQSVTVGSVMSVIAQLVTIVGAFITQKEESQVQDY